MNENKGKEVISNSIDNNQPQNSKPVKDNKEMKKKLMRI